MFSIQIEMFQTKRNLVWNYNMHYLSQSRSATFLVLKLWLEGRPPITFLPIKARFLGSPLAYFGSCKNFEWHCWQKTSLNTSTVGDSGNLPTVSPLMIFLQLSVLHLAGKHQTAFGSQNHESSQKRSPSQTSLFMGHPLSLPNQCSFSCQWPVILWHISGLDAHCLTLPLSPR